MKLIVAPVAAKALLKLPAKDQTALVAKLKQIAADPQGDYPWAKRLTGRPDFRVRQGDWRAIYRLDPARGEMTVDLIEKRGEVYR